MSGESAWTGVANPPPSPPPPYVLIPLSAKHESAVADANITVVAAVQQARFEAVANAVVVHVVRVAIAESIRVDVVRSVLQHESWPS